MILYFTADLLWATKIKGTADSIGISARPVRNLEMLKARLGDSPVKGLLVDLEAPETAIALIDYLRGTEAGDKERGVKILAFGPHVATEQFAAAKAAGADTVMARGGLNANLPRILESIDGVGRGE